MSEQKHTQEKGDILEHLDNETNNALMQHTNLSGCYSILGPIKICYTQNGSSFKVYLNIAGVDITCANLDTNNPCVNLDGSVILAKASVEVCIKGTCLTYSAKGCTRSTPWSSWSCSSSSGNIICF